MNEINTKNRTQVKSRIVITLLATIIMACMLYSDRNVHFDNFSESFAVSMINAAKYDVDISSHKYGLAQIRAEGKEEWSYFEAYDIYADGELFDGRINEYHSQLGLQGWIFYFLTKAGIPSPVFVFRVVCCLLLSLLLSLICHELYKKYGLLLSVAFFIASMVSPILGDFSTNLYWVPFTWFIPMYLGLLCLNNIDKRIWLYPLFFLAILVKSACGYEYITVIMLSSVMFLFAEFVVCLKNDRQRSKLIFKSILSIGVVSLLGFVSALTIHSYIRGDGNILVGLDNIYRVDVLRRTFGNALEFHEGYADSLNASILSVLMRYPVYTEAGKVASFALVGCSASFLYAICKKRNLLNADFLLFISSLITCISWFVLGKEHSYSHIGLNNVMLYMGFIQIGFYVLVKNVLMILHENKEKVMTYGRMFVHRLKEDINRD